MLCLTSQYKYQLNVDGTVAAYRFPYLLAGDSLVLKQESPYYEHFYSKLEPWTHYVPMNRDLSDVVEKVQWARDHDEEVSSKMLLPIVAPYTYVHTYVLLYCYSCIGYLNFCI